MGSKGLFRELTDAGVSVVANDGAVIVRTGVVHHRSPAWKWRNTLHFDHRKMAVIDGRIAYVGGSGIEDHYNDERFYDVMCRVTGPVVAQLQLVFLTSWRYHDGRLPDDAAILDRWFPADILQVPDDASIRASTTILWNVPGTGHHPISDAIERSLEEATDRIDIVNPYISNRAILRRVLAAAERGVTVRIIVPGKPTPPYPAAAFRHWYERLMSAGVEILLHPEMAHAKVLRVDDRVLIGGCNLDDLSLFRNDELDLLFDDPQVAELTERAIFDELVAMSAPAETPSGRRTRAWNAAMDRVSRFL
jgi:phosphatidylserine/phosphatidylglycerophosphate/cardiolipin synthase-like enzyme